MHRTLLAGALLAHAGPALASPCGDRIAALDRRLNAATTSGVAASPSGHGVAASREKRAQTGAGPTTPFQETGREEDATRRAAQSGGGSSAAEACGGPEPVAEDRQHSLGSKPRRDAPCGQRAAEHHGRDDGEDRPVAHRPEPSFACAAVR